MWVTITIAPIAEAWRPVSPIAILPLLTSSTTIGRAVENPSSGATRRTALRGALDSEQRSTGLGDERWALDLALPLALRDPEGQRPDYRSY